MTETQAGRLQATYNPELDPSITEKVTESSCRADPDGALWVVMCQGQGSKVYFVGEGCCLYAKGDGHQAGNFTLKCFRKSSL